MNALRGSGRCRMAWTALLLLGVLSPPAADAHKPSDSYLRLSPEGDRVRVRWDVALRDLDVALGLDVDDDGRLTWSEVRDRHRDIGALLLAGLTIANDGAVCDLPDAQSGDAIRHALSERSDGRYAVLQSEYRCASDLVRLDVDYALFADLDPTHRGIVAVDASQGSQVGMQGAVLGPERSTQSFELGATGRWATFRSFAAEGVHHIWEGYDHLLFLVTLLLPSVLVGGATASTVAAQQAAQRLAPALWDVIRIITAFTIAHSLTLTLAVLDRVSLPSRVVESAIAATVFLAALNNLYPVVRARRWLVALGFGLIHGFGFGQALKEQALPPGDVFLSLLGFNLGVEAGQLAVVAAFVPIAFSLRRTLLYRRGVVIGGSVTIALIALIWFIERAFDLSVRR